MALQQHKVLLILVSLLFTFPGATVGQQQNVGPITVTVTDKYGRYVAGLSKDQITILDEKIPQEIVRFEQLDEPLSLVLLFDVSWSMSAAGLTTARDEFLRFVDAGSKSSDYAIIGFGKQASVLTEFTQDRDSLVAGLNELANLKRSHSTGFYDAFSLALEKVQTGRNKKRVILIVSDGVDNDSNSRMKDVREKLRKTDVLVYGVGVIEAELESDLNAICSMTGGRIFYSRNLADTGIIFEALTLELKNQYSVTFRPSGVIQDGEWRRLKYKVAPLEAKKNPNSPSSQKVQLNIRGREGYFFMKSP